MRAAVFKGPQQVVVERVPIPAPAPGQVLVRNLGCGVCGSNLPVWEGRPWFEYPMEPGAPGHEAWGVIERTGPQVSGFCAGDAIVHLGQRSFAEFEAVDASAVVKLPESLSGVDFPGEPLACAMNVLARSKIKEGSTLGVVGAGFLGALFVQLGRAQRARVLAISRRPFALRLARSCGAAHAIPWNSAVASVAALTDGGCDVVIEAVGTQEALDVASQCVRRRGRLVIAGYHQDGERRVNMQRWNWDGIDVINAHEREPLIYVRGIRAAIDAVASGKLVASGLLTHSVALHELPRAFALQQQRPDGFLKAYVKFEDKVSA